MLGKGETKESLLEGKKILVWRNDIGKKRVAKSEKHEKSARRKRVREGGVE